MRLIDFVFRPISTARHVYKLMKDIELQPVYAPIHRKEVEHPSGFVTINSTFMIPTSVYEMIKPSIVLIESSGYGSERVWRRNKKQAVSLTSIPFENAVAMCVIEKLEQANGN